MEIFLLLALLVILLVVFSNVSGLKNELVKVQNELFELKNLINRKDQHEITKSDEKPKITGPIEQGKPAELPKRDPGVTEGPAKEKPAFKWSPKIPEKEIITFQTTSPTAVPAYVPPPAQPGWFSKWLQDNPDMEKFIGENLINKIGISVLVLGIAFFVKYAIDQEWINKIGRVCIGLFCGIILTWLGNRLRKNYHAFSSVLVGGSLAVFYFTIAFAFHQYHLISQGAAFGIMIIITVFAVVISILYDRIELGILATIGGFITPFLVSQGDGNWFVLFSYLSILNAGLIVLAYYKRWRTINFIAFFFTQIIYLGWVISKTDTPGFNYQGIFIFGMIFYIMFLAMNVIHHVIRGSKLKAFDFIILLSANLCFFGSGIYIIRESGASQFSGLFTASLGLVNLVLAYLFFKQSKADKKFIYLLIGITISFISLAAPVQLRGHYITLFWSAEIVVLLWLYQKSFIILLKTTVLLVTGLMLISLVMDWSDLYSDGTILHPVLFNKGWMTGICSSLSLFLVYRLLRKEADTFFAWGITNKLLRNIYFVSSVLILFAAGALEINDQFTKRVPVNFMQTVYEQLYLSLFVLILLIVLRRLKYKTHRFIPLILPFLVMGFYLSAIESVQTTERSVLDSGHFRAFFTGSWISALFILLLVANAIKWIRENMVSFTRILPQLTWIIAIMCVIIFSAEIRNAFVWINYSDKTSFDGEGSVFDKAGLTVVWAVSSFFMIWLGMKYRYKPLRITALVLFGVTLIKLFMFDIRDIAPGGKIIAFILLGALLLIISFMYQRLKKIIIDDSVKI